MKSNYSLSLVPKLIYVMRINDPAHKGCLKVGDATVEGGVLDNNDLFRPNKPPKSESTVTLRRLVLLMICFTQK